MNTIFSDRFYVDNSQNSQNSFAFAVFFFISICLRQQYFIIFLHSHFQIEILDIGTKHPLSAASVQKYQNLYQLNSTWKQSMFIHSCVIGINLL